MAERHAQRRLAAILAADVAGYSRLMEADEEGTRVRLRSLMSELVEPQVATDGGRVVSTAGDGMLMEFASVVDAVRCALAIQAGISNRNASLPADRHITLRIGINLGDVLVEGADIHGEGVNIAARLESLCPPGEIYASAAAVDQVAGRLAAEFTDLGPQTLKNISRPVRVYHVSARSSHSARAIPPARRRLGIWAAACTVVALGGAALVWQPWKAGVETASVARMAHPMPDRPSIAVLPFGNLSNDTQQEYFVDGMTEDLITDLSKVSGLFVIARNTVFAYKGKAVKVRRVAEELGVRYVLEGSVRKIGSRVRINAQLIDALSGGHVWAERFDGETRDVLEFQDKVMGSIVAALAVRLTAGERKTAALKETVNPDAHDAYLKGRGLYHQQRPESLAKAIASFEKAIALDPGYSRAYAALAATYWQIWKRYWFQILKEKYPHTARLKAESYLDKALKKPTPLALQLSATILAQRGEFMAAVARAEQAVAADPNDPGSYMALAGVLNLSGRPEEALAAIARAKRLNPHGRASHLYEEGLSLFISGRYQAAAKPLERAVALNSEDRWSSRLLLAVYGHLGKTREAEALFRTAEANYRGFDPLSVRGVTFWYPFRRPADAENLAEGLRRAGVPE